jgi:hypothetical protein
MDVANVVTPERAVEINSVMAKIAASTLGLTKASGEAEAPKDKDTKNPGLKSILDSLPEPKPQGKAKPRRATSSGSVDPQPKTPVE